MDTHRILLLSADLDLAARLQTRLRPTVVLEWCGSVREVTERLEEEPEVAALLVDVPRRSPRMLRGLRHVAALLPALALVPPGDEPLAHRCLDAGARQVLRMDRSVDGTLLETCLATLLGPSGRPAHATTTVGPYLASLRPAVRRPA